MMDIRPPAAPAKRQWLSNGFVRNMLAGHSALGIAFAALIYIVCFSGTVLVFLNELRRWEQPDAPVITAPMDPRAIADALVAIHAQARAEDAAHDVVLIGPTGISPRFHASYHDDDGTEAEWILDDEGLLAAPLEAPWSQFVADLHIALHLPRTWGLLLVGLTGVALLSSLISGILSHPRIFKDAFALRWGGARRLQEADLHNRLGVWGLPFHVAVSLTGALLGLSTLIIGVLAFAAYEGNTEKAFAAIIGPMAGTDSSPAPVPDMAAMIRRVQESAPAARFVSAHIQHIGTMGQVVHLGMKTPGYLPIANTYYFDGAGRMLGEGGLERGSVGQQILGALQPLHFGWFGGLPVKIAYAILGLALTIVSFNGVTIWLVRRRDKGRAAPRLERVWTAIGWSQPIAFGATAIAALAGTEVSLPAVYALAVLATFAPAFLAGSDRRAATLLRLASALVLCAVVAVHALAWTGQVSDPAAHYVNAVLVLAALTLVSPLARGRSRAGGD